MGRKTKRQYTLEFKQQAAELAARIGFARAAQQLGVAVSNIHGWNKDLRKSDTKKSKKSVTGLEAENQRLERENNELRKVNDILKRAAAFFSQGHLK
jgi:transposase